MSKKKMQSRKRRRISTTPCTCETVSLTNYRLLLLQLISGVSNDWHYVRGIAYGEAVPTARGPIDRASCSERTWSRWCRNVIYGLQQLDFATVARLYQQILRGPKGTSRMVMENHALSMFFRGCQISSHEEMRNISQYWVNDTGGSIYNSSSYLDCKIVSHYCKYDAIQSAKIQAQWYDQTRERHLINARNDQADDVDMMMMAVDEEPDDECKGVHSLVHSDGRGDIVFIGDVLYEIMAYVPKDRSTAAVMCTVSTAFYLNFLRTVFELAVSSDTYMVVPTVARRAVRRLTIKLCPSWTSKALRKCLSRFSPETLLFEDPGERGRSTRVNKTIARVLETTRMDSVRCLMVDHSFAVMSKSRLDESAKDAISTCFPNLIEMNDTEYFPWHFYNGQVPHLRRVVLSYAQPARLVAWANQPDFREMVENLIPLEYIVDARWRNPREMSMGVIDRAWARFLHYARRKIVKVTLNIGNHMLRLAAMYQKEFGYCLEEEYGVALVILASES